MNEKMRRAKQEITDREVQRDILKTAVVGHFGFWDGQEPYVIPMNFGWEWSGEIPTVFIHCAREGRKISLLEGGDTVCFEAVNTFSLAKGRNACSWSVGYRSFMGWGIPERVEAPEQKRRALNCITAQYDGGSNNDFPVEALKQTAVYRIPLEKFSAKENS